MRSFFIMFFSFLSMTISVEKAFAQIDFFQQENNFYLESDDSFAKREFNYPGQVLKYLISKANELDVQPDVVSASEIIDNIEIEDDFENSKILAEDLYENEKRDDELLESESMFPEGEMVVTELENIDETRNPKQDVMANLHISQNQKQAVAEKNLKSENFKLIVLVPLEKENSAILMNEVDVSDSMLTVVRSPEDGANKLTARVSTLTYGNNAKVKEPLMNIVAAPINRYFLSAFFIFMFSAFFHPAFRDNIFPRKRTVVVVTDCYIGKCLTTENYAIFSRNLNSVFLDQSVESLAKFASACEFEITRKANFKIPEELKNQYLPIDEGQINTFIECFNQLQLEKRKK